MFLIFTKKLGISKAIMEQTGRGVTTWDGEGAYTQMRSYILFVMVSKYEVNQIKHIVHSIQYRPECIHDFDGGFYGNREFREEIVR